MNQHLLRRIAAAALFALLLPALILLGNTYLTQLDTFAYATVADMGERSDIEMAIVGSSVAQFHFNPEIITEATGLNTFCATITNLRLPGAIALTEQLFETNSPEWVVLVVEAYTFDMTMEDPQTQMKLAPLLKSPLRRARYYWDTATQDGQYIDRLLLMNGFGFSSMDDVMKSVRLRSDWRAALAAAETELDGTMRYIDGYVRLEEPMIGRALADGMERFETGYYYDLFDYSRQRLLDFRALCEAHGAKLLVAVSPTLSANTLFDPCYLPYVESACRFLRENEIPCINMLYAKPELMPNLDDMYVDPHHLHGDGADIMSAAFAKAFNMLTAGEDISPLFHYNSWHYLQAIDYITNVWAHAEAVQGGWQLTADCNRGATVIPEYRYALLLADGSEETLRDYSGDPVFTVPQAALDRGSVRVYARCAGDISSAVFTDTTVLPPEESD
ncbi:MAG: hypothetical protein J6K32_11840 [Clostridia bacterium]|nr:hypothetical protein [Clostridia bacterium]MBP3657369.1 hypothetical protein [Clostridia bacterium]